MPFSLYDVTVPPFEQTLGSMLGLLAKAEAFCVEAGIAPEALIGSRLADDMLPFGYQIRATTTHSIGAIEGARSGLFQPDRSPPPNNYSDLRDTVTSALDALRQIDPSELEALEGRDVRFDAGSFHIDFLAEDFLLSFSKPNFYFHATTAYDILRLKGVAIGKRDYLGKLTTKPAP
jgi:hypothetical protein